MKLCLHLSYIAQNSFHFDEIFHRNFKIPILRCVALRRHLVVILGIFAVLKFIFPYSSSQELAYSPTPSQEGPHFGTASFSNNFGVGGHGVAPTNSTLSLQHIGIGGNAIAAAASQAIAATQQLSGRRSSSLKASYEAINLGVQTNEFTIGRELAGAAQAAIASTSFDPDPRQQAHHHHQQPPHRKHHHPDSQSKDVLNSPGGGYLDVLGGQDSNASYSTDQEWNYDPNEPRYCICNQVSYGDMVACDNDDVSYYFSSFEHRYSLCQFFKVL